MSGGTDREPAALPVGPGTGIDPDERAAADASLLALVDRLAALLERSDLTELEVEAGETSVLLRKAGAPAPADARSPSAGPAPAATAAGSAAGGRTDDPPPAAGAATGSPADAGTGRSAVLAPLTGIFYASPSPGLPPFVEAGREVALGQVIGLIEAMKLFNEIKSDRAGRVVRVVAEDGMVVKAKTPLIEVEPL